MGHVGAEASCGACYRFTLIATEYGSQSASLGMPNVLQSSRYPDFSYLGPPMSVNPRMDIHQGLEPVCSSPNQPLASDGPFPLQPHPSRATAPECPATQPKRQFRTLIPAREAGKVIPTRTNFTAGAKMRGAQRAGFGSPFTFRASAAIQLVPSRIAGTCEAVAFLSGPAWRAVRR
jgi:hypothetical protein